MSGRRARKKITECKLKVKPLSVNQCWQGRRFKTAKYKDYEKEVMDALPDNLLMPREGTHLQLYIRWGFSSKMSDWDNPIKPFQDILQKKYNFDDRYIYLSIVEKEIVPKGQEYIYFRLTKLGVLAHIRLFIKELFHD